MNSKQKEAIRLYKKSLKPESKFYVVDLKDFTDRIKNASPGELNRIYTNLNYLQSSQFAAKVNKEVDKMDKAGMFNPNKLKPGNALD